jgi:outer membrane protein TolC
VLAGPVEEREKDVEALIDLARSSRPDLAAAEAQVKASEANVQIAKSANMPTVSLVGNYNYYMTIDQYSISSWQIGVQISTPLFTGFNNTYQIKNAEEQVDVSAQQREALDKQIAMTVWQSYYTLEATRENLKNTEQLLDNAIKTEKLTLGRYQEGVGNIVELLNSESNLANARYQYVQAHFNWRIGKAQLAQALGRLDLDEVSAVSGIVPHVKKFNN